MQQIQTHGVDMGLSNFSWVKERLMVGLVLMISGTGLASFFNLYPSYFETCGEYGSTIFNFREQRLWYEVQF